MLIPVKCVLAFMSCSLLRASANGGRKFINLVIPDIVHPESLPSAAIPDIVYRESLWASFRIDTAPDMQAE